MVKRGVSGIISSIESSIRANNSVISEEENRLADISQIILRLNKYEDIYSDFDPRHHSKRALSDDFLFEAQKASSEKVGDQIELRLLVPKNERNLEEEAIVKRRLHEHFGRHFNLLNEEIKGIKIKGALQAVIGASMLVASAYLSTIIAESFRAHLTRAMLEPAGWFIAWYGLDQVFYWPGERKRQKDFYEKMHKSRIVFSYY